MTTDPIVKQVRAAREAYAKRFGFDLRRIADDLRAKEQAGRHPVQRTPAPKASRRRAAA